MDLKVLLSCLYFHLKEHKLFISVTILQYLEIVFYFSTQYLVIYIFGIKAKIVVIEPH